jgi:chloride channel 7
MEDLFVGARATGSNSVRTSNGVVPGYLIYMAISIGFGGASVIMTCYFGPGAAGSGVAEVIGMLNGIVYPNCIGFRTLITKIFGVVFAVSGGLKVGKEGPLAHIGANIGAMSLYIPVGFNEYFRNDKHKREVMAAGAGAGVAAAFGAPVGGALFAYEISKPANFWSFGLLWQTFLTTSVTCFLLNIFIGLKNRDGNAIEIISGGIIKFGSFEKLGFTFGSLIPFVIIGVICGLFGALYCYINLIGGKLRK